MECVREYQSKCVRYSGPAFPDLGILPGQSVDDVLAKLVAHMSSQGQGDTVETPPASSPQIEAVRIEKTRYHYNLMPGALSYSLMDIMQSLPSGYSIAHKRVAVYRNGIPIASSNSTESVLPLKMEDLPAQVHVDLSISTPETILQYEDRFSLAPSPGEYSRLISYKNDTEFPVDTAGFQETVKAELKLLKREIFERRDASPTPVSSADLSKLQEEIKTLKRELAK